MRSLFGNPGLPYTETKKGNKTKPNKTKPQSSHLLVRCLELAVKKQEGHRRSPPKTRTAPPCLLPPQDAPASQPGRACLCSGCSAGKSGSQTSQEIGCVKHASDQIQPTASNLFSQSLKFQVFGLGCCPGTSNIWTPPRMLRLLGAAVWR